MSILIPGPNEFIIVNASAPAFSAYLAISVMSVTFGVNLTKTGILTLFLTDLTISAVKSGSCPIADPHPPIACGHDTLSSKASTKPSTLSAISENSSGLAP